MCMYTIKLCKRAMHLNRTGTRCVKCGNSVNNNRKWSQFQVVLGGSRSPSHKIFCIVFDIRMFAIGIYAYTYKVSDVHAS